MLEGKLAMVSSKKAKPRSIPILPDKNRYANQRSLSANDTQDLDSLLQKHFGWPPHSFQINAIRAQLLGHDTIVHAGTGSGKTAIAAGPHFHPKRKGFVTIFVSPLIALQDEQVSLENPAGKQGRTHGLDRSKPLRTSSSSKH